MIGVLEGFFGPPWHAAQRLAYASFLKKFGAKFYIYAPKADPYLRKRWQESHPSAKKEELKQLSAEYKKNDLLFGLGFSPFELHNHFNEENIARVKSKLKELQEIGFDYLGLFLDDMTGGPDLAQRQLEMVDLILNHIDAKVLFCPTYYSDDPILDKVFGTRPPDYLEEISQMPPQVDIMWTGPKVISDEISPEHLDQVKNTLKRKPFIWDNLYANDGPKNCKFLKLFAPEKRSASALSHAAGWALNPMNQAALSQVSTLSYIYHHQGEVQAFDKAVNELCPEPLTTLLLSNAQDFNSLGLDQLEAKKKKELLEAIGELNHPVAEDLRSWLKGESIVDNECLTD